MDDEKLNEQGSGRQPTPTKRKGEETMKRYKVITRLSNSNTVIWTEHFETLDDAISYVEEQRRDDMENGEADEYEYEIKEL